jgi:hypothetical protein
LLAEERAALLALLDFADFAGRDALREQASVVRAVGECPCGCATVGLVVDPACPSAGRTYRPIPNEADVLDADGENVGGVIVFADDGYLSGLEIFSYEDPINPFPPLDELRLFNRLLGPRPT